MCGSSLATMVPIFESTDEGNVFSFDAVFTTTSADGGTTSNGFSLSIVCKFLFAINSFTLFLS